MTGQDAPLFPLFLKLAGRPVLLVGGGEVARAKAEGLLAAGAALTVVAPVVDPALRATLASAGAQLRQREFEPADLDGAWLVVAAAPPAVNRAVLAAAEPRRLFVNSVDDPGAATCYSGAVVRKGPVTLAISTGGAAPALAGLMRQALEAVLPEDLSRWGEVADEARRRWKAEARPMAARRPLLLAALNELYTTPTAATATTTTTTTTAATTATTTATKGAR
jgi:uroporphyrin-III C-methyltransferase / precorrin-2 dehydrogenase / sirohydrochlorin ferrochelatase